jgi:hypothetical protein
MVFVQDAMAKATLEECTKKIAKVIPNPSPCPSSLGAREPISVAIPLVLPRKKAALMQKVNVSHGKTKVDKAARRRELPCRLW